MKIALVADWLNGFAGSEQVVMALHELFPEAPLYTSVYNEEKTPQFAKVKVIPSYLQKVPTLKRRHQVAIPLMPLAFESFDLKEYDVVISIGGGLAKGVITQPNQRHITFCNTPMRYLWHLGGDERGTGSVLRDYVSHKLRIWDVVSADRVDQFVANSETVAARIAKIYRKEALVIYPPVNTTQYKLATEKPKDYFLSVGRLISYKRVDLVVQACIDTKMPLKVAGTGPEEAKLKAMAADAPWIEFLGRVPDRDMEALYQGARAFLFAAEEDFGIVPVEAMSVGRPVIAFGKGGATESVKAGSTGVFFMEQTAASLAEQLTAFRDEEWDPATIRKRAEQFDVQVFKDKMKALVEKMAKEIAE